MNDKKNFIVLQKIPPRRCYTHDICNRETCVADDPNPGLDSQGLNAQPHTGLSDPYCSLTSMTYCSNCQQLFKLEDFFWSDTGEPLPDYITRWREEAKRRSGFLATKKCAIMVSIGLILLAILVGVLASLVIEDGASLIAVFAIVFPIIGMFIRELMIRQRVRVALQIRDVRQLV